MWLKETIYSYSPVLRIMIDKYLKHQMTENQIKEYLYKVITSDRTHQHIQLIMESFLKKGIWFFQALLEVVF